MGGIKPTGLSETGLNLRSICLYDNLSIDNNLEFITVDTIIRISQEIVLR